MPELPEVETIRRGLALRISGRQIVRAELRRPDLRRPFPPMLATRLEGALIAALSPRRLAATVIGARAERLAAAIREVLGEAIEAGGSSLRDYVQANGELGYFQHRWAVYGREGEPCSGCNCAEGVRRIVQSGRSTFFCAKRQR